MGHVKGWQYAWDGSAEETTDISLDRAQLDSGLNFLFLAAFPLLLWIFDSTFAVGLCMGLIVLFRGLFNRRSKVGTFLSRQSYAVYIIHIPIVVFLAYALRGVELAPLLKFGLASLIIVPICFIVAAIVRKIPFASRII